MFDIGFWELAVVAIIGLIVLGPERLPVVARTLGKWVARARRYASELTSELENEMSAADIRREVREARQRIESETKDMTDHVQRGVDLLNEPAEDPADSEDADAPASDSEHVDHGESLETDDNRTERGAGNENRK